MRFLPLLIVLCLVVALQVQENVIAQESASECSSEQEFCPSTGRCQVVSKEYCIEYDNYFDESTVSDFNTCMNSGLPIYNAFPRECTTPYGEVYKEVVGSEIQARSYCDGLSYGSILSCGNYILINDLSDEQTTCYAPGGLTSNWNTFDYQASRGACEASRNERCILVCNYGPDKMYLTLAKDFTPQMTELENYDIYEVSVDSLKKGDCDDCYEATVFYLIDDLTDIETLEPGDITTGKAVAKIQFQGSSVTSYSIELTDFEHCTSAECWGSGGSFTPGQLCGSGKDNPYLVSDAPLFTECCIG